MSSEEMKKSKKQAQFNLGVNWGEEAKHLSTTFLAAFGDKTTVKLVSKFVSKYKNDPIVSEFSALYKQMADMISELSKTQMTDPVERLNFSARYLEEHPQSIKLMTDFANVMSHLSFKYQLFDGFKEENRKNNLRPKESAVLQRNLMPVVQWLPKIKLHLEASDVIDKKLVDRSHELTSRFQAGIEPTLSEFDMKMITLKHVIKPMQSIFSRKRREAFKKIESCHLSDITEFLIRHKDDHPEYMDAIFRRAKRGDRDFLKEFDAEHDHKSLNKLYATQGVGLTFVDKINKAYHFSMEIRLSVSECIKQISDNTIPKELQTALMAKMEKIHRDGFIMPTAKEMSSFVNDLKAALNKPEGLNYSNYVKLLVETSQKDSSRTAMFGLERDVFANNKVFKMRPDRPAPVAPPRTSTVMRNNTQGRVQR